MVKDCEPVFWRGEIVGHIEEPKRFPAIWRGKWSPMSNEFAEKFMAALRRGAEQWVEYGTNTPRPMGRVEEVPDEEIEVHLDVEEERTLLISPFAKRSDK